MRPDTLRWEARYNDGTVLSQNRADGGENRYADIDRSRLDSFALVRADGTAVLQLHLDTGQRLIFRRRVEQQASGTERIVYLVGWQQTVNGTNIQSIAYVTGDGETHLAGRWREDHPWFYSAQPVPCEAER
jgi:hypothetical protein